MKTESLRRIEIEAEIDSSVALGLLEARWGDLDECKRKNCTMKSNKRDERTRDMNLRALVKPCRSESRRKNQADDCTLTFERLRVLALVARVDAGLGGWSDFGFDAAAFPFTFLFPDFGYSNRDESE